jgi:chromosome segregation ATPase
MIISAPVATDVSTLAVNLLAAVADPAKTQRALSELSAASAEHRELAAQATKERELADVQIREAQKLMADAEQRQAAARNKLDGATRREADLLLVERDLDRRAADLSAREAALAAERERFEAQVQDFKARIGA